MTRFKLSNPYPIDRRFALKGNLHTHTDRSDGKRPVQDVIDDYAGRGYDFLMISDHDLYLDLSTVDPRGMLLIPGTEISAEGIHILQVGANEHVAPNPDRQTVIDDINRTGAFPVLCHPRWQPRHDHIPQSTLEQLSGYSHLEVYNAGCRPSPGSPDATGNWDILLSQGRTVWGHAADDTHSEEHVAHGWDVVFAPERSVEAVLTALREGAFTFSTGVTISEISVDGDSVHVETEDADLIEVSTANGYVVAEVPGNEITFSPTPRTEIYCRVTCYGRGRAMAWTQPFSFVPGGLVPPVRKIGETAGRSVS